MKGTGVRWDGHRAKMRTRPWGSQAFSSLKPLTGEVDSLLRKKRLSECQIRAWLRQIQQSLSHSSSEGGCVHLFLLLFSKYAASTWPLLASKNDPLSQLDQCSVLKKKRNIFGILRCKQRHLHCGHSWGKYNRWLDFLLLWQVVLDLQRRYFLTYTHENQCQFLGAEPGPGTVSCLLRKCQALFKGSYFIEYNI